MLFRGRIGRTLDAKGRIMLPPDFREILLSRAVDGRLALTTYDGCIVGFPWPDWEEFEATINRIKNPSRTVRDFRRLVVGGAEVLSADGQGRIRLSREQLAYAGIEKDAVLMGQGPRFEIWDASRLAPVLTRSFDDVALSMEGSGLDFAF